MKSHRVIVEGHRVPFLEALPANGGKPSLVLDGRYGLDISVADAGEVMPFIADRVAVAMGYACHPSQGKGADPLQPLPLAVTVRAGGSG